MADPIWEPCGDCTRRLSEMDLIIQAHLDGLQAIDAGPLTDDIPVQGQRSRRTTYLCLGCTLRWSRVETQDSPQQGFTSQLSIYGEMGRHPVSLPPVG